MLFFSFNGRCSGLIGLSHIQHPVFFCFFFGGGGRGLGGVFLFALFLLGEGGMFYFKLLFSFRVFFSFFFFFFVFVLFCLMFLLLLLVFTFFYSKHIQLNYKSNYINRINSCLFHIKCA